MVVAPVKYNNAGNIRIGYDQRSRLRFASGKSMLVGDPITYRQIRFRWAWSLVTVHSDRDYARADILDINSRICQTANLSGRN